MSWQENAPCRRRTKSFVFDTDERHNYGTRAAVMRARIDQAGAVCATCPMRQQCLDAELDWMRGGKTSIGVFGGTSQAERRWLLELDPDVVVVAERRLWTLAESMRLRVAPIEQTCDNWGSDRDEAGAVERPGLGMEPVRRPHP